jgi:hypothetical protein
MNPMWKVGETYRTRGGAEAKVMDVREVSMAGAVDGVETTWATEDGLCITHGPSHVGNWDGLDLLPPSGE